jgi:hypothetical protein
MFNVNKFLHTCINTSNKQRIKKQNFAHKNEHPFRQPTQPKTPFTASTEKPQSHQHTQSPTTCFWLHFPPIATLPYLFPKPKVAGAIFPNVNRAKLSRKFLCFLFSFFGSLQHVEEVQVYGYCHPEHPKRRVKD